MILLVATEFFGKGAVSNGARQYARALVRGGHEVAVVTDESGSPEEVAPELLERIEVLRVPVWRIPRVEIFGQELSFAWNAHRAVRDLAKRRPVDLVLSQASTHTLLLSRFSKRRRIPAAFVIRGLIWDRLENAASHYNHATKWLYLLSNRHAVARMPYLVAISDYMKTVAAAHGARGENVYLLYNPVDTSVFRPREAAEKDVDILYVGRLSVEKGLDTLMDALDSMPPETRVLVVGEGGLRPELEARAAACPCRVRFAGWVPNQSLPEIISRARVQVVPSRSEPQGRVVLEAMACGVTVIGSATGGIREMVRHGQNGWLVPPQDAPALARAMLSALENPAALAAAGGAALETARGFSLERFEQRLLEIVADILARGV